VRKWILSLPKFKTRYNLTLNDILHQMGIKLAFQPLKADFSGMSDNSSFISFVKQFTYINTDEVGTEAAAVTVVGMLESAAPPTNKTIVFNANRPFVLCYSRKLHEVNLVHGYCSTCRLTNK
jgi:serine protease inhibitor